MGDINNNLIYNEDLEINKNKSEAIYNFQKNIKLTVFIALTVTPLLFMKLERFDSLLIRVAAMFILVVSYILLMVKNMRVVGNIVDRDRINGALLFYLCLLIISLLFSENKILSIYGAPGRFEGIITMLLYMFLFAMARSCPMTKDKFWILVMCSSLLVSIYGIVQFYGFYPLDDVVFKDFGGRPSATMGNPNFLGTYLVLIMPISIYLFIIKKQKIGLVGFGILLYCMLCTNTRSAWLGAMASMISFFVLHYLFYKISRNQKKRYIALFMLAIFIVLIFNFQTGGKLLDRFMTISNDAKDLLLNNEDSDNAGAHRGFIWKRVMKMIVKRPLFGYGIENLLDPFTEIYEDDIMLQYGEIMYFDKAHNEYLNIAVTSGIPSLIAYLAFVFLIFKKGLLNFPNNPIVLMLMTSIIGYLVQAFFNISMVVNAYVFWIFLGLVASSNIFENDNIKEEKK